jgi:solute:Na+ symporter, SSS family
MPGFHLALPDYVVVAGYFVIVLWVGFYFRASLTGAKDYFAGGHRVRWWMAGISHYMSSFSAFSFIAYAQIGYSYGWVAITLFWVSVPACILGGLVFARRWRRARVITPVEFLEARFSPVIRQLFAWAGIPMKIFDDALKVFATGLFVSLAVGINLRVAIVASGAVMVAYTLLGGLWALIVTDFVQFLMKGLAMLLLLPLAFLAAGGLKAAFTGLPQHFLRPSGGPYDWIYIAGFTGLIAISYNGSWALAQKYYSVEDDRSATKAAYLAAGLNFVGAPVMILPAIWARKFLPDLMAQHRTADVYVQLVLKLLPAGMVGIIIAAMFSATMATVSADYNSMASVLTKDVYHRLLNPGAAERGLVQVGRLVTLALGIITVLLALWVAVSHEESLFQIMVTVFGLLLAPTLLPLLAGLTVKRLTRTGALAGLVVGLLTGIVMLSLKTWYLPRVPGPSSNWVNYTFEGISLLVNIALTILAMWMATVLFPAKQAETERIRNFFAGFKLQTAPEEKRELAASPIRAIGISTAGVGMLLVAAGILSVSFPARAIDVTLGAAFVLFGIGCTRKG